VSDEHDDHNAPTPPVYIGNAQLPLLMKHPIQLPESMRTKGASVKCACGWTATTRTVQARDEMELEHRRYHDWQVLQTFQGFAPTIQAPSA
jgi:hypothetical protein